MSRHSGQRHRALPSGGWLVAGLLGLIGAGLLVLGLHRPSFTPADEGPVGAPQPTVSAAESPRPPQPTVSADQVHTEPATPTAGVLPVRLSIPAIRVAKPLLRLGVNRDKTVEVPTPADAALPGWFRLGTPPGEVGSAVILGHVDSLRGPAVFYRLRLLVPGNRVDVRRSNGTVARFKVTDVVTYPNAKFPARMVYASHGYPALNLVTCGGAFDRVSGYQANVVVYTRLVHTASADPGSRASEQVVTAAQGEARQPE